jgi:FkbM family methyltransferase
MRPTQIKRRAFLWIGRHWRNPLLRQFAFLADRFTAAYRNENFNATSNGEWAVLQRLPEGTIATALDVGAFNGEWTQLARSVAPKSRIHCFEPSPEAFTELSRRFGDEPGITLRQEALGASDGRANFYLDKRSPTLSSLVPREGEEIQRIEVRVRTGDGYLATAGVDRVDFLKIDAEGNDLDVLRGFRDALAAGAIRVIQFEYSPWNRLSRTLLRDFYELLEPLGYRIGKIHPDCVAIKDYSDMDENFVGPACVAVARHEVGLLAALAADLA